MPFDLYLRNYLSVAQAPVDLFDLIDCFLAHVIYLQLCEWCLALCRALLYAGVLELGFSASWLGLGSGSLCQKN